MSGTSSNFSASAVTNRKTTLNSGPRDVNLTRNSNYHGIRILWTVACNMLVVLVFLIMSMKLIYHFQFNCHDVVAVLCTSDPQEFGSMIVEIGAIYRKINQTLKGILLCVQHILSFVIFCDSVSMLQIMLGFRHSD
jgi:type IV secretory pathway VirB3-like protein